MSAGILGALAGLAIGYMFFEGMNQVAKRVEKPDTRRVLRIAGIADLIVMPIVGFFVARTVFGG